MLSAQLLPQIPLLLSFLATEHWVAIVERPVMRGHALSTVSWASAEDGTIMSTAATALTALASRITSRIGELARLAMRNLIRCDALPSQGRVVLIPWHILGGPRQANTRFLCCRGHHLEKTSFLQRFPLEKPLVPGAKSTTSRAKHHT